MSAGSEFSPSQTQQAYPPGMENHFWNRARNRIVLDAVRRHFPQAANAVEIGCGSGILTRFLNERGLSCHGCDLASNPHGPGMDTRNLWYGTSSAQLPEDLRRKADLVLLPDVLEHVPDAAAFLREQFCLFPNARNYLVTLPARKELWTNFDEHYGHYRRYDTGQASSLAQSVGAEVRYCGYFFHALYPVMRLMSLAGVRRGVDLHPPSRRTLAFHKLASLWFRLESRHAPGALPGTSVLLAFSLQGDGLCM